MDTQEKLQPEESLDPQDWDALRELGHQMLDDMFNFFQELPALPVWQAMPDKDRAFFKSSVPHDPQGFVDPYQDFKTHIMPYLMGNVHPRFWGWVMGTGSPYSMLAEMLAAGINTQLGGGDHAAYYVELQVIDWFKQLFGFPESASGLLTSGCSMANLIALTVARNRQAGFDIRLKGVSAAEARLVMYASSQVHSSNVKAVEILGLGRESLRLVPVDAKYRLDLHELRQAVQNDRDAGYQPVCVIGNAGTVNTGAIDPLNELADFCEREGLWYHIDGAFGALAALTPDLAAALKGMERADSLAFDLHKWGYMPFEIGCVLVRREQDHRSSFSFTPEYLAHQARGPAGGATWFSDYGVQLTRGFRALKVWMEIKAQGIEKFGRLITQNIHQARYLMELVEKEPNLELTAPVPLNIVCFRYHSPDLLGHDLNTFNEELLLRLQESGVALPSYTTLNGVYMLRACITNHRTRYEDLEMMVQKVLELGAELERELRA